MLGNSQNEQSNFSRLSESTVLLLRDDFQKRFVGVLQGLRYELALSGRAWHWYPRLRPCMIPACHGNAQRQQLTQRSRADQDISEVQDVMSGGRTKHFGKVPGTLLSSLLPRK